MVTAWIVAYKNSEFQNWQEFFGADELSMAQDAAKLIDDTQLVCIFYNRPGWQERHPRYVVTDRRDKSNWPINGLGGLINSLQSDWF